MRVSFILRHIIENKKQPIQSKQILETRFSLRTLIKQLAHEQRIQNFNLKIIVLNTYQQIAHQTHQSNEQYITFMQENENKKSGHYLNLHNFERLENLGHLQNTHELPITVKWAGYGYLGLYCF